MGESAASDAADLDGRRRSTSRCAGRALLTAQPEIRPAGEAALLVSYGDTIDAELNKHVLTLDATLRSEPASGITELVPALTSLLVRFDPTVVDRAELVSHITDRAELATTSVGDGQAWVVPCVYGGDDGPDLAAVAESLGLSVNEAIDAHTEMSFSVLMLGFAPGFAYLGVAPPGWDLPRRAEIRPSVPAGSVLLAVRQTAVSGTVTPTGWHVIGRTPIPTFIADASEPFLFSPGDSVSFRSVGPSEAISIAGDIASGSLDPRQACT